MANRTVKVESEVFVGGWFYSPFYEHLNREKGKHLSFSRSKVNWIDGSNEFKGCAVHR